MIMRVRLTRDGEEFVVEVWPYQAHILHRALSAILHHPDAEADTALAVRLGASPETVRALTERFAGEWTDIRELRFTIGELHLLHSALTGAAVLFVERGFFSDEAFYAKTASYREHFDALALSLVEALSRPGKTT